jgi:hypothetical protein
VEPDEKGSNNEEKGKLKKNFWISLRKTWKNIKKEETNWEGLYDGDKSWHQENV